MVAEQIEQRQILTGHRPTTVLVGRGWRGELGLPEVIKVLTVNTRGNSASQRRLLKWRNAIEPMIGHVNRKAVVASGWPRGPRRLLEWRGPCLGFKTRSRCLSTPPLLA